MPDRRPRLFAAAPAAAPELPPPTSALPPLLDRWLAGAPAAGPDALLLPTGLAAGGLPLDADAAYILSSPHCVQLRAPEGASAAHGEGSVSLLVRAVAGYLKTVHRAADCAVRSHAASGSAPASLKVKASLQTAYAGRLVIEARFYAIDEAAGRGAHGGSGADADSVHPEAQIALVVSRAGTGGAAFGTFFAAMRGALTEAGIACGSI